MAYYSIDEIKIAALDAMMENSTFGITGMPFLAAMLEKLNKPEPVVFDTKFDAKTEEPAPEKTAAAPAEPAEQKQEPRFVGTGAELKRATLWAMESMRAGGKSAPELSKMTHGKVSADDVTEMLARGRVAFDKWKAMAKALDVEVAS